MKYAASFMLMLCLLLSVEAFAAPPRKHKSVQKSKHMRKIEQHSRNLEKDKKNESPKVIAAEKKQRELQEAENKELEVIRKKYIKAHRDVQTKNTLSMMDGHAKDTKVRMEGMSFWQRLFHRETSIEKIEKQRAKEVERRMIASARKAEQNNKNRMISSVEQHERKSHGLPRPEDYQHGGGGVYKEGASGKNLTPTGGAVGGGGTYREGRSGKNLTPTGGAFGGGGTYREGRSGKNQTQEGGAVGGGGSYREGGSGKNLSGEKFIHGGGGRYREGGSGKNQTQEGGAVGGGGTYRSGQGKATRPSSNKRVSKDAKLPKRK